ncbi:MAG: hypothetical protein PHE73_09095 [Sulfurovaceae bacterium]|nr:hypothetical protein [Sulfurovaceae bacterium]
MKSIVDRIDIIEKHTDDVKDLKLYISGIEDRLTTLEDIVENKLGIYIPKKTT